MLLSGTATGTCDCYVLTTTTSQAGSVWSPVTIDLTNPFDFTFRVNLGSSDGGADGMVFVLRQSGTTTGIGGGSLGYGGINNSIGIEIDTWNNGTGGDIASDHIGMNSNGVITHNLVPAIPIANIENGVYHDFRVTWNPVTLQLETFLDDVSIFIYTGDMVTAFFGGNPEVYFGWTGATGGASNVQSVCIDLEADFEPDDLLACPGQEITFTNTSLCPLIYNGVAETSWAWTFGGGGTSSLENPTHIYPTIGTKTITLTVTNMIGCTDVYSLNITVDSIDIEVTGTDITCFGYDDGSALATALTGDAPYTYLWDDPGGQTTAEATDLPPGSYTVLVTDAVGCQQWRSVTITEPTALVLDDLEMSNATCGLADAELTFFPSGGTPGYEYSIDGGITFFAGSSFTDLPDGSIDFVIRDANGCTFADMVVIESDDLELETTHINVSCFGFDDGQATVTPAFGVGPCSYSWDDPLMQITPTAIDLAPGDYTVTVMHDDIGCSGTALVTITQPEELIFTTVLGINASCGVNNGQISLVLEGGTLPYEYSIDDGGSFFGSSAFYDLAPGTYDVVARDANGCEVSDAVTLINVANIPIVEISADFQSGCKPLKVLFRNDSDPALTANTFWDFGDGFTAEGNIVTHTYTAAGCYDVHVLITTFDGCTTEATFTEFICVWELPIANFDFSPTNPDAVHSLVDFDNLSEFATTYEWEFGDGETSSEFEPQHNYPQMGDHLYPVRLIAISDKLCRDTAYASIFVNEIVQYYIPNIFTPDGDAFNQTFKPVFMTGFVPTNFHFSVYNKWGEILWESYDPTAGWAGTYGEKLVEDGVYVWQLSFKSNQSDKKFSDFGHVTVLK